MSGKYSVKSNKDKWKQDKTYDFNEDKNPVSFGILPSSSEIHWGIQEMTGVWRLSTLPKITWLVSGRIKVHLLKKLNLKLRVLMKG